MQRAKSLWWKLVDLRPSLRSLQVMLPIHRYGLFYPYIYVDKEWVYTDTSQSKRREEGRGKSILIRQEYTSVAKNLERKQKRELDLIQSIKEKKEKLSSSKQPLEHINEEWTMCLSKLELHPHEGLTILLLWNSWKQTKQNHSSYFLFFTQKLPSHPHKNFLTNLDSIKVTPKGIKTSSHKLPTMPQWRIWLIGSLLFLGLQLGTFKPTWLFYGHRQLNLQFGFGLGKTMSNQIKFGFDAG